MKQLFLVLARYNAHANKEMFDIVARNPDVTESHSAGSYFESILGILNHTLVADLGWLNGYRRSDLALAALDTPVVYLVVWLLRNKTSGIRKNAAISS